MSEHPTSQRSVTPLQAEVRAAMAMRPRWTNDYAATTFGRLLSDCDKEMEGLQQQKQNLLTALNAKQARIDALMLEFCPGEMSAERRAEWAKSQQAAREPAPASSKERVPVETIAALREMAWTVAVKGKLLLQLLDEIEDARGSALEPEEALDDHSELLKKLPNVRGDLLEELKPLSKWALIRRVLIQADWLGSYSRCIDGFEFRGIPGSGIDSARTPRNIRRIVEHLRASKPPELKRYRRALQHIAYEPLTDDPEASAVKCLEEATRIAREALAGPTKRASRFCEMEDCDQDRAIGGVYCPAHEVEEERIRSGKGEPDGR